MPGAIQMDLKPRSRCSSMFAGFAPMLLLRNSVLRTAAGCLAMGSSSGLSDVLRELLVFQKLRIGAE